MSTASKKLKYCDDYIKFGFIVTIKNDAEQPQSVICYEVLSNDAWQPKRLMQHLDKTDKTGHIKRQTRRIFCDEMPRTKTNSDKCSGVVRALNR